MHLGNITWPVRYTASSDNDKGYFDTLLTLGGVGVTGPKGAGKFILFIK